ncbi:MAG TPA: RNase adapter RapZ, partial [Thermoanaerobaculia bacterium]|nr:RNase adapter RapZ [Thermoanaerobaculia bacterium]
MSETEKTRPAKLKLVLITGLSGSGKSVVAKCFEDLSYYTVDNLPLPLLRLFLDKPRQLVPGHDRIAVVTDVRAPGFAEEFPRLIAEIDREKTETTLLFLETSDEVLVRRFSETRRPHPLAPDRPVIEGIQHEREILAELRARADMVFDTSEWSIHEIRSQVYREFASSPGEEPGMVVSLVSFGFKFGIPYGTDLLF